ncbi:hypothetical protein [Kitasatospora nipponensis]
MTDGSSGAPEGGAGEAPQDDDPFAYLYRPAEGEAAPDRAPVAPRTAYNRPMEVGRAQYGQPAQTPYQQPGRPPQQQPHRPHGPGGEQTTQVPHQQSRYAERSRPQPGEDAPRGRGKGPVIGVVAVVAAIAIGSGIALSGNDGKSPKTGAAGSPATAASTASHSPSAPASASPSPSPSGAASATTGSTTFIDASKAQAQNAPAASTVKGAISADGSYLTLQQGSTASWSVTVPSAGQYKFWVHYSNNGDPVKAPVSVNGQDHPGGTTFKSYSAKGADPSTSWTYTNIWPQLQAGTNTVTVTIPAGGPVLVDQVAVTGMDVNGSYPSAAAG